MTSTNENKPSGILLKDKWNQISEKSKDDESWLDYTTRNTEQNAARATEFFLGLPGGLKKAITETREMIGSKFLPEISKEISEHEQKNRPEEGGIVNFLMNPPSSQDIREKYTPQVSEKLFGSKTHLEPRGKGEEFMGNLTQDVVGMFMPGSQLRLATRIGAPIISNLAKEGLKYVGVSDENAEKAKLGIQLITSIAGQSNPGQFSSHMIRDAKQMVPENFMFNVGNLANRTTQLFNRLSRGMRVPSKSQVFRGMEDLNQQVQGNQMSLRSLMDARDDINEWIAEAKGFDVPVPVRDRTLHNLNEMKRHVIDEIHDQLQTHFPEVNDMYRNGYEAAAVNHASNAISNFVEENFGRKFASASAKILFPGLAGASYLAPKAVIAGGVLFPLYKTGQVFYRIANSPTLAHYYQDVISQSLRGNVPTMVKSMDKLDKELEKQEKKEQFGKGIKKSSLEEFKSKFKKKG